MAVPSRLLLILIACLLLVAGGWYVYTNRVTKPSRSSQSETMSPTVTLPQGPYMYLESDKQTYVAGDEVVVRVYANSQQTPISGYDAVIRYNPEYVEYLDARSVTDAFSLYTQPSKGTTSLTGMRPLNDSPAAVSQVVAEARYRVIKTGKVTFELKYSPGGTADSNLIDSSSKDILSSVNRVEVLAGEGVTLVKNKPQKAGDLTLTLESYSYIAPSCADCMESATIKVQRGDEARRIEFRNGGIVGYTDVSQQVFGYEIVGVSFSKEGVVVNYSKL